MSATKSGLELSSQPHSAVFSAPASREEKLPGGHQKRQYPAFSTVLPSGVLTDKCLITNSLGKTNKTHKNLTCSICRFPACACASCGQCQRSHMMSRMNVREESAHPCPSHHQGRTSAGGVAQVAEQLASARPGFKPPPNKKG
jgi:hypothetical protein